MGANIFMYVRIVQMLNRRRSSCHDRLDHHQTAMKLRNQVAKMLIVNGAAFFVCQTPNTLLSVTRWICLIAQIPNPLDAALGNTKLWIALIPQRINTIVNPLIYGAINTQYQTAFKQAFRWKGKSKKPDSANTISSPKNCSATNVLLGYQIPFILVCSYILSPHCKYRPLKNVQNTKSKFEGEPNLLGGSYLKNIEE